MKRTQPITIVGGGLAGLSLGTALCKAGVPTRIIEAGDYPRHRVCGEFITGLDDGIIDRLGIRPAFAGAGHHRSMTWFRKGKPVGRNSLPSPARALSRYTLDARLAELFKGAGGELATRARFTGSIDQPGWVQTNGRRRAGASSWMGLKLHARNLAAKDDLELHLGDGAYVGVAPVEEGWVNVCGLFRRRPGLHFARDDALPACLRASGLHDLQERLAGAEIRPGSRSAVAGFVFDRRVTGSVGVRLGDACAMIPPFTGNGMAMAFTGSALALDPLVAWARGEHSWSTTARTIRHSLHHEFKRRLATAAGLHPLLLARLWQSCLGIAGRAGLIPFGPIYTVLH